MLGALYPGLYAAGPPAQQVVDASPPISVQIKVGGAWTEIGRYTRVAGATITQALNETIDTASITLSGSIPFAFKGAEIQIITNDGVQFAGFITAAKTVYEGIARNVAYQCDCLDYTWLLNAMKVSRRYLNTSVYQIVADLVTTLAPGFWVNGAWLSNNVVLDEITFTNEELGQAISRTCERGGAYWFVGYDKTVYVFNSAAIPSAGTIDQTHPRQSVGLAKHDDYAGVATRIRARGGGAQAAADVAPGSTTIPVEDGSWYASGLVESGPQQIQYAAVIDSAAGAVVGSGGGPTSGPVAAAANGSNLTAGATYQYAVTFVTAAGETLPGGLSTYVAVGNTVPPAPAPAVVEGYYSGSTLVVGGTYRFAFEKRISGGRVGGTPSGPITVAAGSGGKAKYYDITIPSSLFTDPVVTGIRVCRTVNGGGTFYDDVGPTYTTAGTYNSSQVTDSDLLNAGAVMAGSGAALLAATLSGIAVSSASGVTSRKIYRTAANGSQLKLLGTIANNTATTFTDTITDAALGANAPTLDTSGIKPDGQVPAGSSTILVSNPGAFLPGGGWVTVGNQTLRYTGISGSALVLAAPLPATISYGTAITASAFLTGIPASGDGAILYPIARGDDVYVYVMRYDNAAIAALAAATGSTGVRDEFLTDGRLSITELTSRADALLAMRKDPLATVTFDTRDPAVTVGKTITVNTTAPPISGTFLIQRVTITDFPARGSIGHPSPKRSVEASSRRFTFDDLVQQLKLLGRIN